jgi:hypothetical protein
MHLARPHRFTRSAAVAAGSALDLVAALALAGPAYAATWSVVATPNASTGLNVFVGVDATAPNQAWAVGHADHSPAQPFQRPLIARWNGTQWTLATSPALPDTGFLRGVDASSATNAWAVGQRAVPAGGGSVGSATLTERWNGTSWSIVPSPSPGSAAGSSLEGVKTFTTTDAWAVGTQSASTAPFSRTLIERWDGTAWSVVPSPNTDPNRNFLTDVDGASATDVWAIGNVGDDGYGGTTGGVVLHWNGMAWSPVTVPGTTSDATLRLPVLEDVVARAANDVWIVGRAFHFGLFRQVPVFMHWNGSGWQSGYVPNAPAGGFSAVTALSATQVYAAGGVIARWTGTAWAIESATVPGSIVDATAAGTGTVLLVGYRYDPGSAQIRTLGMRTANG